jgi:hypothetical protein
MSAAAATAAAAHRPTCCGGERGQTQVSAAPSALQATPRLHVHAAIIRCNCRHLWDAACCWPAPGTVSADALQTVASAGLHQPQGCQSNAHSAWQAAHCGREAVSPAGETLKDARSLLKWHLVCTSRKRVSCVSTVSAARCSSFTCGRPISRSHPWVLVGQCGQGLLSRGCCLVHHPPAAACPVSWRWGYRLCYSALSCKHASGSTAGR